MKAQDYLRRRSRPWVWPLAAAVVALITTVGVVTATTADANAKERHIAQLSEPRIVGGSKAAAGAYPQVAFLVSAGVQCSGTLIRPVWVLTAGHCVDALHPYNVTVSMGGNNNNFLRNYPVSGIRRHPDWPSVAGSDPKLDIALVRLAKPVRDISPRPLAQGSDSALFDDPADAVRSVGWGLTACQPNGTGGCNAPNRTHFLQTKTGTPVSSTDVIKTTFSGGGPCYGDSGGPLLVNTPDRGEVVVGVLSKAGCESGSATYVNVATGPARAWVLSVLDRGAMEPEEKPWTAANMPVNDRKCFKAEQRDVAEEPIELVPGLPAYRTSWWVYDPGPVAHRYHVTTNRSVVDTVVAVFKTEGDTIQYDNISRIAFNDDSGGAAHASVVMTTPGNKPDKTVYLIAVGTKAQDATGRVCVQLFDTAPATSQTSSDIVWYNTQTGETQIWFMDHWQRAGRGTVVDEYQRPVYIGPPFEIVGTSDFNGDRKADILWYNTQTGETQIWFMTLQWRAGRGTVVDENGAPIAIGPPFEVVATSDMDGDGKADIVWYNTQTGETQIWFMNSNQIRFRQVVADDHGNQIFIGPPFELAAAADMNVDGKGDLIWYNTQTGEIQIWYMDVNHFTSRATVVDQNGNATHIGPPFHLVGAGDMDLDGVADFVWHNDTTLETQIWFMTFHQIKRRRTVVDETSAAALAGAPFAVVGVGVFNPTY